MKNLTTTVTCNQCGATATETREVDINDWIRWSIPLPECGHG